jgi:hypothetical protein
MGSTALSLSYSRFLKTLGVLKPSSIFTIVTFPCAERAERRPEEV